MFILLTIYNKIYTLLNIIKNWIEAEQPKASTIDLSCLENKLPSTLKLCGEFAVVLAILRDSLGTSYK